MRKAYIRTSHIVVEIISFIVIITSIIYAIVKAASIEGDVPTHIRKIEKVTQNNSVDRIIASLQSFCVPVSLLRLTVS